MLVLVICVYPEQTVGKHFRPWPPLSPQGSPGRMWNDQGRRVVVPLAGLNDDGRRRVVVDGRRPPPGLDDDGRRVVRPPPPGLNDDGRKVVAPPRSPSGLDDALPDWIEQ